MHGFRCHIVFGALLLALLLSSCGKDEPKHLSQRRFGELYADMLLADEWIALHPQTRRTTDTLLVYASIFEHYGVTVEDVHANLEYYLEDPLRYSRALEVTIKRLERHSREIKNEIDLRYGLRDFVNDFQKGARMDSVWHFTLEDGIMRPDSLTPIHIYRGEL